MVIGLTGGIGSGKSTIATMFSKFKNVAIYIADLEAKKLMNSSIFIKEKITSIFGKEAYKNNELNKKYIASIVFNNKEKLTLLNNIVHPEVHKHFSNFIEKNKNKAYIIYENAILFENGSNALCHKTISITAPLKTKIERVIKRDNTTEKEVLSRINNQWPDAKKLLASHYKINNISLLESEKEVFRIHNILTRNS